MYCCVSFVPCLLVTFCSNWWNNWTDTGLQSVCTPSHCTHIDKHTKASLWWGTAGSSATSSSSWCSGPLTGSMISSSASAVYRGLFLWCWILQLSAMMASPPSAAFRVFLALCWVLKLHAFFYMQMPFMDQLLLSALYVLSVWVYIIFIIDYLLFISYYSTHLCMNRAEALG